MNDEKKYEKAFDFIFEQAIPDDAELDRMSQEEVEAYLAESGVDLEEFKKRRAETKRYFAGKFALMRAKQERSRKPSPRPAVEIPPTREGILKRLLELFSGGDPAQVYGRNFEEVNDEELRQLYIDMVAEEPGTYGDDAPDQHDKSGEQGQ